MLYDADRFEPNRATIVDVTDTMKAHQSRHTPMLLRIPNQGILNQ